MIRSDNNGSKCIQQMWQFSKWHPAPFRAYSYLLARPVIKVFLAELKCCFITKKRSKQGTIVNAVTEKVDCQKFWIQQQFRNKSKERDFFKYICSTKKNPEQSKDFKDLATWISHKYIFQWSEDCKFDYFFQLWRDKYLKKKPCPV